MKWLKSLFKKSKPKELSTLQHFGNRLLADYLISVPGYGDPVRYEIFYVSHYAEIAPNRVREILEFTRKKVSECHEKEMLVSHLREKYRLNEEQSNKVANYVMRQFHEKNGNLN